jgi:hypothetical protein
MCAFPLQPTGCAQLQGVCARLREPSREVSQVALAQRIVGNNRVHFSDDSCCGGGLGCAGVVGSPGLRAAVQDLVGEVCFVAGEVRVTFGVTSCLLRVCGEALGKRLKLSHSLRPWRPCGTWSICIRLYSSLSNWPSRYQCTFTIVKGAGWMAGHGHQQLGVMGAKHAASAITTLPMAITLNIALNTPGQSVVERHTCALVIGDSNMGCGYRDRRWSCCSASIEFSL